MNRNETLLKDLYIGESKIIEVGASFCPVAPKRSGWITTVVDYADRNVLVEKYQNFPDIDLSLIEDVDVVWSGGKLDEAGFPANLIGQYDAIIASHVIEHIVDPISFFNSAGKLLSASGCVILAVPDKRLCFDCFRPVSTTGQIIAANRARRSRHSLAALFDAFSYDARPGGTSPSWARNESVDLMLCNTLENVALATKNYEDNEPGEYKDVHSWVFTPASFSLIMLELHALGLIEWEISTIIERQSLEFLVIFRKSPKSTLSPEGLAIRRKSLMIRHIEENRDHADWLLQDLHGRQFEVPSAEDNGSINTSNFHPLGEVNHLLGSEFFSMIREKIEKCMALTLSAKQKVSDVAEISR